MTQAWASADGDPVKDLREGIARIRAEMERPYRAPVYYLPVWAYDLGVFEGIITLSDPMWRPYPLLPVEEDQDG